MIHGGVRFDGRCCRHSRARYATVDEETLEASERGENLAIFFDKLGPDDRLEVDEVEEATLEP